MNINVGSEILAIMILFGGICGLIGMVISLICLACVVGFTRSTHNIQYVPLEEPNKPEIKDSVKTEEEELEEEIKKVGRKPRPTIVSDAEQEIAEVSQTDFLN